MYLIGIDIGTTGTKSMLIDSHGKIVKSAYKEYELITPTGFVEQDANDWWNTVVCTVRECVKDFNHPEKVAALSMSTQGGSIVAVGKNGETLANAVTWMDARGKEFFEPLAAAVGEDEVYRISGWKMSPTLCATKVLWYQKYQPELIKKAHKLLTTVDFVNFKLTGRYVIDQTNAGITQLFDINKRDWSDAILEAVGISRALLPEIVPTGEIIGNLTKQAADELGLTTAAVVVSGAHDQYAAATGAGAVADGDVLLSTGTAWAPLGISAKPLFENKTKVGVGNHTIEGLYGVLCTVPAAGVGLEWLRRNFARQRLDGAALRPDSFAEIDMEAKTRIDNTKNLFFFPNWNGSFFPRWNSASKATFFGLSLEHDFYDEALAVMEGVTFEMAQILEGYAKIGSEAKALRLVGGASKSPLWTEIISCVTGLPIIRFKEANIACIGAAALAGSAVGVYSSLYDAVMRAGEFVDIPAPSGEKRKYYADKFERYKMIIPNIEAAYNAVEKR